MPRLAPLLVALVALLAGCNNAGDAPETTTTPTPSGPPPPPPPPSEGSVVAHVNDTWRYSGDANETVVSTVTGANATMVRLRTVSERPGGAPHTTITTFDARTLAILSVQDQLVAGGVTIRFDPPLPILIPAEDHVYNGTLIAATPFGDVRQQATANVRFLGLENVTVPAGSFATYRYNATIRSEGLFPFAQETEIWFSPEVEQAVRTIRDGHMQELVSYEIG
ncbi:MAG TPA: hypothetical protein VFH78_16250 [Candidatus Thermoplasmatota archaeon]|nr:hypothetical protein [Candidatus Thermoplasmatota archaeon]